MFALYFYLVRVRLIESLTYRFEYFSSIGTNLFILLGSVYLWKAAYKGIDSVAGVNQEQMITYSVVSVLMHSLFCTSVGSNLYHKVRYGDIATDFLRPLVPLRLWFGEDVGQSFASASKFVLPLLVVSVTLVKVPLPADSLSALLFLPSCVMSYVILWQVSALLGITAFWVTDLGSVGRIESILIFALSGRAIPIWLFPESVQRIMRYLPFKYTYQIPLEVYIGRLSPDQYLEAIALQGIWILGLSLLITLIWRRAQRRVFVQGG